MVFMGSEAEQNKSQKVKTRVFSEIANQKPCD